MKKGNILFVYLNPEKDDSVQNISGINMIYKDSTSKFISDSYNFLAQSFVNGGKNWWLCLLDNMYNLFWNIFISIESFQYGDIIIINVIYFYAYKVYDRRVQNYDIWELVLI